MESTFSYKSHRKERKTWKLLFRDVDQKCWKKKNIYMGELRHVGVMACLTFYYCQVYPKITNRWGGEKLIFLTAVQVGWARSAYWEPSRHWRVSSGLWRRCQTGEEEPGLSPAAVWTGEAVVALGAPLRQPLLSARQRHENGEFHPQWKVWVNSNEIFLCRTILISKWQIKHKHFRSQWHLFEHFISYVEMFLS